MRASLALPGGTRVAAGVCRMRVASKVAFAIYLVTCLGLLVTGAVYVATTRMLPYHAAALGQSWETLDSRTRVLYLASAHAFGAATLVVAAALLLLLLVPWRRGARWARIALPGLALGWVLPLLAITLGVRAATGAEPPTLPLAAGAVLIALAAALSLLEPAADVRDELLGRRAAEGEHFP